jgi:hypothetical protein
MSAAFSPQLEAWARQSGRRLAERYCAEPHRHASPAEYFATKADRAVLTQSLRPIAEPAFLARIAEVEADAHGGP